MKAVVINAGPKRKDFNAQVAQSARDGAESVGAEVTYVDLHRLNLSGCRSCLICKRNEDECKCYWKDELSPLIEEIFNSDALLIAAPIFFSQPTSLYMAFLERLIFSLVSFKTGNKFKGKVNVGLFYTMEYPMEYFEKSIRPHLKPSDDLLAMLNGNVVIDVFYKFSKNMASQFSEEEIKIKEEQMEKDLDKTHEIGADLCR